MGKSSYEIFWLYIHIKIIHNYFNCKCFLVTIVIFFIIFLSKSFQFHLAKSCFIVSQDKAEKLDKIKYCLHGLKAYNSFLARYIGASIDQSKIYSKILSSTSLNIRAIIASFDDEDKLKPVAQFVRSTNSDELVSPITRLQVLKEVIEFLLALLPITVAILAALLPTYSSSLRSFFGQ